MKTKDALKVLEELETKDEVEDVGELWSVAEHFRDRYEKLKTLAGAFADSFEHDPKTELQSDAYDALEKELGEP